MKPRSTVIFFKKNLKHERECVGWLSWKAGWKLVENWEGHSLPLRMPLFLFTTKGWFTGLYYQKLVLYGFCQYWMMMIQDCKSNHRPFDIINSEHELPDQNFAFNGPLSEGEKKGNSNQIIGNLSIFFESSWLLGIISS